MDFQVCIRIREEGLPCRACQIESRDTVPGSAIDIRAHFKQESRGLLVATVASDLE